MAATRPPDGLDALAAEAAHVRDRLEQDALALAGHCLVDGAPIAQVRGGKSYRISQEAPVGGPSGVVRRSDGGSGSQL